MFNNLIIAHRGVHDNKSTPENSIKAFYKAVIKKYPIELDIQLTKDNEIVVFHDKNLKRMTGLDKDVEDLTLSEIKKLKLLDTNEHIPTLDEVLKLVNGKVLLDIEIKPTDKYKEICALLNEKLKDYKGDVLVKSFDYRIPKWFKKNNPNIKRGLLLSDTNHCILRLLLCKPDFLAISKKCKINNFIKKYPILLWTIKDTKEFNDYENTTTNFICNNL